MDDDQAVQWIQKQRSRGEELLRFKEQAAALLGVSDAAKPDRSDNLNPSVIHTHV